MLEKSGGDRGGTFEHYSREFLDGLTERGFNFAAAVYTTRLCAAPRRRAFF